MIVPNGLRFRRLRVGDVAAVMAIDAVSFPQPWGKQHYLDDIGDAGRGVHLVATRGRSVVGHAGLLFLTTDAHVSTVAVHPDHHGQGIGSELVARLVAEAVAAGCNAMTLEVRAGNAPAQALYRRFGFAPVGVRPGYYDDPGGRVDALIMWLHDVGADTVARAKAVAAGRPDSAAATAGGAIA